MRKFKRPVKWSTFVRRLNAKSKPFTEETETIVQRGADKPMGRYFNLNLKPKFCGENSLQQINNELFENYNCPSKSTEIQFVFNTRESVYYDVLFINHEAEGIAQCPHIPRPLTAETLIRHFPDWFEYGRLYIKLSGGMNETEAKLALAVAQWAETNDEKINKSKSDNYDLKTVRQYCRGTLDENQIKQILSFEIEEKKMAQAA